MFDHDLLVPDGLQHHLLGFNDLVTLLVDGLGGLVVDVHFICRLLISFEFSINGMLRTRQSVLCSGAHIVYHYCKFILNSEFLTPPINYFGQRAFVFRQAMTLHILSLEEMALRRRFNTLQLEIIFSAKVMKIIVLMKHFEWMLNPSAVTHGAFIGSKLYSGSILLCIPFSL